MDGPLSKKSSNRDWLKYYQVGHNILKVADHIINKQRVEGFALEIATFFMV